MSDIVQSTIIAYFDDQNALNKYQTGAVIPVIHTDNNAGEKEDGGVGPFIRTAIIEQNWEKLDSNRRTVGDSLTHCSFEEGQFICQIHSQVGLGSRDLRIQQKVADAIKKDFVALELTTGSGVINFGESTSRQPIPIPRERKGGREWFQLNLFINYVYSEGY